MIIFSFLFVQYIGSKLLIHIYSTRTFLFLHNLHLLKSQFQIIHLNRYLCLNRGLYLSWIIIPSSPHGSVVQRKTYSTPIVQGNCKTHIFLKYQWYRASANPELPYSLNRAIYGFSYFSCSSLHNSASLLRTIMNQLLLGIESISAASYA